MPSSTRCRPPVAATAFRNAQRNSDRQNARIEHDKALLRVMTAVMRDDTELFKQFMDNASCGLRRSRGTSSRAG